MGLSVGFEHQEIYPKSHITLEALSPGWPHICPALFGSHSGGLHGRGLASRDGGGAARSSLFLTELVQGGRTLSISRRKDSC